MGHIGIGFCFSRAIFTGYVIMVQNGITTRLLQQMAAALPKPTLLSAEQRDFQQWIDQVHVKTS